MQRQPGADQIADQPHAFDGHQNIEGLHRQRSFFPTFAPRPDVAHGPPMTSLDGAPQARRRPRVRRIMLSDFRSYGELDLAIEGRLVVLCGENGAGKTNLLEALSLFAPGRGLRRAELAGMRAGRRRRRLCAIDRDRGGRRDPSARLGLEAGRQWRRGRAAEPHRPRGRRLVARVLRPCADRLADASDGFAVRRAGEPSGAGFSIASCWRSTQVTAPGSASSNGRLRGRNRLLEEGGRNAAWLDAIEREAAELGVAVAAARLECVRRLEALIAAERDDSSPFPWAKLALKGEIEAMTGSGPALAAEDRYRASLRDNRGRDAAAGRTLVGPHLSDFMVWHGPKQAPAAASSTGEQKALIVGLALAHARLVGEMSGDRAARPPRRNRGPFRSAPPRRTVRRARAPRRPGVPDRRGPGRVRRARRAGADIRGFGETAGVRAAWRFISRRKTRSSEHPAWPASEDSIPSSTPRIASARSYLRPKSRSKMRPGSAGQVSQPLARISLSSCPEAQPA